jgi:hypothetical protein
MGAHCGSFVWLVVGLLANAALYELRLFGTGFA